jgi:hypothetical protein
MHTRFWYSYIADLRRKFASSFQVLAKFLFKVILEHFLSVIAIRAAHSGNPSSF